MLSRKTRSPVLICSVIFAVGVVVRVWVLLHYIPAEYIAPHTRWEAEAVAVSLATEGTFADPYAVPTGPTAHVAPAWPFLLHLVYRGLGLTRTAGYVTWAMGIVVYATMFALLPWVSLRLGVGAAPGVLAGFAGAILWIAWPDPAQALAGLAMELVLVAFVSRWSGARPGLLSSLLVGVGCALALHAQPALLPVVAGCMAFELWWRRHERAWVGTTVLALGVMLTSVPWTVRNYRALGAPVFMRSNLGLELRMAFHEGAHADLEVSHQRGGARHPRTSTAEAVRVRELGEVSYMREARDEAAAWVAAHPTEALRLVGQRFLYYWFGPLHDPPVAAAYAALTLLAAVGLVRLMRALSSPQQAALVIPLLMFPLIYYVMSYMTRYRLPLDWLLLLCAAAGILGWRAPSRPADDEQSRNRLP